MEPSGHKTDKYFAMGTVKGQIVVFRGEHVRQHKDYQYHQYTVHYDRVTQMCFIKKKEDEFQLASIGDNLHLNIVCLKQCITLFRRDYDWIVPSASLVFVPQTKELLALQRTNEIIKFKTQIDSEEAKIVKKRTSCDLESNIKYTLYSSNNQNKLEACIRHIRDQDFYQLSNFNSNTIAILMGRHKLLEVTV